MSNRITPGTENKDEKTIVNKLKPTLNGMKYDSVFTAHKALTPPITLVNMALKNEPLPLYTSKTITITTAQIV
jgi:hypothetical protein